MGIKKSSADERKNKIEVIFMIALIMQCLFILVRKGVFFIEKRKKNANIAIFFFR